MKKIYLIDDNKLNNFISKKALENYGIEIEIVSFTDSLEAFNSLKLESDVLIFLDLNMPELNGNQFLELLVELNIHFPIVILSAYNSKNDFKDYENIIAQFEKPLNKKKLDSLSEKLSSWKG